MFEDSGLAAILEKIPGFDGTWPATMAYLAAHYDGPRGQDLIEY